MAAQPWSFYNEFKRYMADGTLDLDGTNFRMSLYQSASNFATATLSVIGSVTNEVAEANGYSSSGKALTVTWSTGASAAEMRFDAADLVWSASGGTIPNIKAAVIWASGASAGARKLVCKTSLTSGQFTLADGSTLTIQISALGVFELN